MAKRLATDRVLLGVAVILFGAGLLMLWSASQPFSESGARVNGEAIMVRQLFWAVLGVAVMYSMVSMVTSQGAKAQGPAAPSVTTRIASLLEYTQGDHPPLRPGDSGSAETPLPVKAPDQRLRLSST